jgi:hypothetical protein
MPSNSPVPRRSGRTSVSVRLDDTCTQRTGRHEEDGCRPSFEWSPARRRLGFDRFPTREYSEPQRLQGFRGRLDRAEDVLEKEFLRFQQPDSVGPFAPVGLDLLVSLGGGTLEEDVGFFGNVGHRVVFYLSLNGVRRKPREYLAADLRVFPFRSRDFL